jgi:hypothetical protein
MNINAINKIQCALQNKTATDINVFGTSVFAEDPRHHAARDFCTANLRNLLLTKLSAEKNESLTV